MAVFDPSNPGSVAQPVMTPGPSAPSATPSPFSYTTRPGLFTGIFGPTVAERAQETEFTKLRRADAEARAQADVMRALSERVNRGMTPQAALVDYLKSPEGADKFAMDAGNLTKGVQNFVTQLSPESKVVTPGSTMVTRDPRTGAVKKDFTAEDFVTAPITNEYNQTIGIVVYERTTGRVVSSTRPDIVPSGSQYQPPQAPGTPNAGPATPGTPGLTKATPGDPKTPITDPTDPQGWFANARNWFNDQGVAELKRRVLADKEYQEGQKANDTARMGMAFRKHAMAMTDDPKFSLRPGTPTGTPTPQTPTPLNKTQGPKPSYLNTQRITDPGAAEPSGFKPLWQQIPLSTGAIPGTLSTAQRITGQFGVDVLPKEISQARIAFRDATNSLIRATSLNPRFIGAEQERIRQNFSFEPGFFTDERTLADRLIYMDRNAADWINQLKKEWADPKTPLDRRKEIANGMAAFQHFRERLGVPPEGTPERENPPRSTFRQQLDMASEGWKKVKKGAQDVKKDMGQPSGDPWARAQDAVRNGQSPAPADLQKLSLDQLRQLQQMRGQQ